MEELERDFGRVSSIPEDFPVIRMQDVLVQNQTRTEAGTPGFTHPQFRLKAVCKLDCKHCGTFICHRGMKAILLGNSNVVIICILRQASN